MAPARFRFFLQRGISKVTPRQSNSSHHLAGYWPHHESSRQIGVALMTAAPPSVEKPIWKNPFVYTGSILFIVAVYVGWIVFSRWYENRQIERRARDAS